MTKRVIAVGITLVLILGAATTRLWVPVLLGFVGTNSNVIQGLTSFVQLGLWAAAVIAFIFGTWRSQVSGRRPKQGTAGQGDEEEIHLQPGAVGGADGKEASISSDRAGPVAQGERATALGSGAVRAGMVRGSITTGDSHREVRATTYIERIELSGLNALDVGPARRVRHDRSHSGTATLIC